MKLSIIGGGAWGTTLGQTLIDNGHKVLIYDINLEVVNSINMKKHPFFETTLPHTIKATTSLHELVAFSSYYVLAIPTKTIRSVMMEINPLLKQTSYFINVSKGIEPFTLKRVSQIVKEVISPEMYGAFAVLTGPSHAEEVILRHITLLVTASDHPMFAKKVQEIFSNQHYLRVYTKEDLIGCEVGGAIKNAIAVISGICTGLGLGENARAAVITRGIVEIVRVVEVMGGKRETAFGLTGIGDLIVTASSTHSRNFMAGKRIGEGLPLEMVYGTEKQTIEGLRTIEAMHDLSIKHQIELPMIETAYRIIYQGLPVQEGLRQLLSRDLKDEII